MEKCDCYRIRSVTRYNGIFGTQNYLESYCIGTKECEICNCGADESKCDFYPEKRKKAEKPMTTAEMWLKAQEDGEAYITIDGDASYSVADGFIMENLHVSNVQTLSDWMSKTWKKQELRKMTRVEAEKQLGVKIVD